MPVWNADLPALTALRVVFKYWWNQIRENKVGIGSCVCLWSQPDPIGCPTCVQILVNQIRENGFDMAHTLSGYGGLTTLYVSCLNTSGVKSGGYYWQVL